LNYTISGDGEMVAVIGVIMKYFLNNVYGTRVMSGVPAAHKERVKVVRTCYESAVIQACGEWHALNGSGGPHWSVVTKLNTFKNPVVWTWEEKLLSGVRYHAGRYYADIPIVVSDGELLEGVLNVAHVAPRTKVMEGAHWANVPLANTSRKLYMRAIKTIWETLTDNAKVLLVFSLIHAVNALVSEGALGFVMDEKVVNFSAIREAYLKKKSVPFKSIDVGPPVPAVMDVVDSLPEVLKLTELLNNTNGPAVNASLFTYLKGIPIDVYVHWNTTETLENMQRSISAWFNDMDIVRWWNENPRMNIMVYVLLTFCVMYCVFVFVHAMIKFCRDGESIFTKFTRHCLCGWCRRHAAVDSLLDDKNDVTVEKITIGGEATTLEGHISKRGQKYPVKFNAAFAMGEKLMERTERVTVIEREIREYENGLDGLINDESASALSVPQVIVDLPQYMVGIYTMDDQYKGLACYTTKYGKKFFVTMSHAVKDAARDAGTFKLKRVNVVKVNNKSVVMSDGKVMKAEETFRREVLSIIVSVKDSVITAETADFALIMGDFKVLQMAYPRVPVIPPPAISCEIYGMDDSGTVFRSIGMCYYKKDISSRIVSHINSSAPGFSGSPVMIDANRIVAVHKGGPAGTASMSAPNTAICVVEMLEQMRDKINACDDEKIVELAKEDQQGRELAKRLAKVKADSESEVKRRAEDLAAKLQGVEFSRANPPSVDEKASVRKESARFVNETPTRPEEAEDDTPDEGDLLSGMKLGRRAKRGLKKAQRNHDSALEQLILDKEEADNELEGIYSTIERYGLTQPLYDDLIEAKAKAEDYKKMFGDWRYPGMGARRRDEAFGSVEDEAFAGGKGPQRESREAQLKKRVELMRGMGYSQEKIDQMISEEKAKVLDGQKAWFIKKYGQPDAVPKQPSPAIPDDVKVSVPQVVVTPIIKNESYTECEIPMTIHYPKTVICESSVSSGDSQKPALEKSPEDLNWDKPTKIPSAGMEWVKVYKKMDDGTKHTFWLELPLDRKSRKAPIPHS